MPSYPADPTTADVVAALDAEADPERAVQAARYFKTAPGEYGEGDVFIGVRVPEVRRIAKHFVALAAPRIVELLDSEVHEHRLAALFILVAQFQVATPPAQRAMVGAYLAAAHRGSINNWDLVDSSAEFIVGDYLWSRPDTPPVRLDELAMSENVWERRIAVLSTFAFIKHGDASMTLAIADVLLTDPHDLIQKAVGWMLREVGKRVDRTELLAYLDTHAARMPRTMLSYAIEHLDPADRTRYRSLPREAP
jgi:3-methyladenine DNA glycosylase AlkD